MKTTCFTIFTSLVIGTTISVAQAQGEINVADSTGLPGDNFDLEGALELFKTSASLEEFEKQLNTESNSVNNLDLNGDGDIDYVRVVDNAKDSAHAIVLQIAVNESELQDVAVIELEKIGKESAIIQIVGDEELYGENQIAEPFEENEIKEKEKGEKGPAVTAFMSPVKVIVNVWGWPCVRYIYTPAYRPWVSPWAWRHYPVWWKPWRVHPWRVHRVRVLRYHHHYHRVHAHRAVTAHRMYAPHRKTSVMVKTRHKMAHERHRARKENMGRPRPVQNRPAPRRAGSRK